MPEGGGNVVDTVVVRMEAQTAPLKAGLKEGEAAVAQTTENLKGEVRSLGATVEEVGHTMTHAVRAVHHLFALITFATIIKEAYEFGAALREYVVRALQSGTDQAKEFVESLDLTKPTESLSTLNNKIAETSSQLDQMLGASSGEDGSGVGGWVGRLLFGDSPEKAQQRLGELQKQAKALRDQLHAQDTEKGAEDDAQRLAKLKERLATARAQNETEEEGKINAEAAIKLDALKRDLTKVRSAEERQLVEDLIWEEDHKRKLALADLAVAKEQKQKEADAKKAQLEFRMGDDMVKEFEDTQKALKELTDAVTKQTDALAENQRLTTNAQLQIASSASQILSIITLRQPRR